MADNTTNFQRLRVSRAASVPLQIPKFPAYSEDVNLLPEKWRGIFQKREASLEVWRVQFQNLLSQTVMALKLDPGELKQIITTIIQEIKAQEEAKPQTIVVENEPAVDAADNRWMGL
jgi:hypothetical protein